VVSGGLKVAVFYFAMLGTQSGASAQIQFDPPIPKDNTNELKLTPSISWARV
jgi:hypothetical protein